MHKHEQNDPYVYPQTTVLVNKLGIRDQVKLNDYEIILFAAQASGPLPAGQFDYTHLKAIHRHYFADLYEWAGKERTVDIAKDGHLFAHTQYIFGEMNKLFDKLKKEKYLQNLDKLAFCERLSYYFNEINAAHPFREGNGRTQRAFCDLVAEQAGYKLDWTKVNTETYIQASIDGHIGNYNSMTNVFNVITTRQIIVQKQPVLSLDNHVKEKLKDYIEGHIILSDLVNQKNHHLGKNVDKVNQFAAQVTQLNHDLKSLAGEIIADLEMKKIVSKPHFISIHKQGGFVAIHERIQENQWHPEDVIAVLKYANSSVASLSQTISQADLQDGRKL
ncbi:MAG: Fic family protein [Gammaproteobacteria bacterium]|nr:Fic family protein [Gammaproteobacteria bacterium]